MELRANRPTTLWSDDPRIDGYRKPSDYSEVWEPASFLGHQAWPVADLDMDVLLSGVEHSRLLGQTAHWYRDLVDVQALEHAVLTSPASTVPANYGSLPASAPPVTHDYPGAFSASPDPPSPLSRHRHASPMATASLARDRGG
jgi:hypothetical protein